MEGATGTKVGIVAPGELFGGVERQVLDLCTGLSARSEWRPRPLVFYDEELATRLREARSGPTVGRDCGGYSPRAVHLLRRWCRSEAPTVLHLHGYKATVTAAVARLGLPVVKTEHGLPELQAGSRSERWRSRLNVTLDALATRRLDAVVCYVTDDIRERFAVRHRGLRRLTVHNGIEPLSRHERPRPADLDTEHFHVGVVGRLTPVKGIDYALRALAEPVVPARVVLDVIGEGPNRAALEALARRLGVGERVRFLGFKRNIHDYLAHLDVVLIPSRHEGLPYTLLEAMSLARPVVASRVGGLAEVLRHGETGWLVDVGAVPRLAAALARLHDDAELARRLGAAAAREQRARYTREAMIDRYVAVYRQALAGARPGSTPARGRGT